MKAVVVLGFFVIAAVQSTYDYKITQTGKNCIAEAESDEQTVKSLISEDDVVPEDNDLMRKIFECCFRSYITDTNELIVDDKLTAFVAQIFLNHVKGDGKLDRPLADLAIEECKDIKGDNKAATAIKLYNCFMKKLHERY